MFDDDEWIRWLTEAQTITVDIPEGHLAHDARDDTTQEQLVDTCQGGSQRVKSLQS